MPHSANVKISPRRKKSEEFAKVITRKTSTDKIQEELLVVDNTCRK